MDGEKTWMEMITCDIITPYGGIDLGQHWLRWWLVAWQHQAITLTSVDYSSKVFCGIHLRTISQEMPQIYLSWWLIQDSSHISQGPMSQMLVGFQQDYLQTCLVFCDAYNVSVLTMVGCKSWSFHV